MNTYVTGAAIKRLREKQNLTQAQLAGMIGVSDKAVSKWETAKGLPDIALIHPLAEAEETDEEHGVRIEAVEDEQFITVDHPMTKEHYISFLAYVTSDRFQMVKLYPEGNAETRLQLRGRGILYLYCNRHGLMKRKV